MIIQINLSHVFYSLVWALCLAALYFIPYDAEGIEKIFQYVTLGVFVIVPISIASVEWTK